LDKRKHKDADALCGAAELGDEIEYRVLKKGHNGPQPAVEKFSTAIFIFQTVQEDSTMFSLK
jgi:hypothetical protein